LSNIIYYSGTSETVQEHSDNQITSETTTTTPTPTTAQEVIQQVCAVCGKSGLAVEMIRIDTGSAPSTTDGPQTPNTFAVRNAEHWVRNLLCIHYNFHRKEFDWQILRKILGVEFDPYNLIFTLTYIVG
jgi:hypothetical protein